MGHPSPLIITIGALSAALGLGAMAYVIIQQCCWPAPYYLIDITRSKNVRKEEAVMRIWAAKEALDAKKAKEPQPELPVKIASQKVVRALEARKAWEARQAQANMV
ncbi:hypothetical protein ACHAPA_006839 [Fusarium lateritium]